MVVVLLPQLFSTKTILQAAGENQLSLAMDDVIFVRSKSDAGWWEVRTRSDI